MCHKFRKKSKDWGQGPSVIQKLYILIPCLIGVRWHVCTPQMFVQPLSPEGLALWIQRYTVGSKSRKTRNFGKLPQKLEFCGV